MNEIKEIGAEHYDEFVRIVGNAYPIFGNNTEEERRKTRERLDEQNKDPRYSTWGLFNGDTLLGGMRLHDWTMTLRGSRLRCGGGGLLAVDLCHKKEHVAKQLMQFFFRHFRDNLAAPIATLWPFRPDFYRKMGAGYGAKLNTYRIRPSDLPRSGDKQRVRFLGVEDAQAIVDCYNRYVDVTNGMIQEMTVNRTTRLKQGSKSRYVGYEVDGRLDGFIHFGFDTNVSPDPLITDIIIHELIYLSPDALAGLMAFMSSQADQINRIVIAVADGDLHHLAHDPRDGVPPASALGPVYHETNSSGIGIMYRVLDIPVLCERLGEGAFDTPDIDLYLTVTDTFLPENAGTYALGFRNGKPTLDTEAEPELEIAMDIADLSSLVTGAIRFDSLVRYSRATCSDPDRIGDIARLFATDHPPQTLTPF